MIDGVEFFFRFAFDDDETLNQQIRTKSAIEFNGIVDQRNGFFLFDVQIKPAEFVSQACSIR